jgi:NADH:ubiquinone oxidoreductase subunit F (NADH-binding)
MAESFAALVEGVTQRGERDRLVRWASEIRGRGACHHPNGAVRLISSSIETFGAELEHHGRGRCKARPADLPGVGRGATTPRRGR